MGEVIVFKAEKDGTHLRPTPEGSAKIVFFTGVWHEPMNPPSITSRPTPLLPAGRTRTVWENEDAMRFGCQGDEPGENGCCVYIYPMTD